MPKILIVDDDLVIQLLYRNVLTQAGHELTTVANGAAALESIASTRPDLVFMDVMMPVLNGIEALRELKLTYPDHCPVIIMTGNVKEYEASRHEAEFVGAVGFLTKPFSPAQLLEQVQKYLPKPQLPSRRPQPS